MSTMVQIVSADGEVREAKLFPDGGWSCPFCGAGVPNPEHRDDISAMSDAARAFTERKCPNPQCFAGLYARPEWVAEQRAKREALRVEKERRERDHLLALERIAEDKRREDERWAEVRVEAEKRGACLDCLFRSNWRFDPKFIRHRDPDNCPRRRR